MEGSHHAAWSSQTPTPPSPLSPASFTPPSFILVCRGRRFLHPARAACLPLPIPGAAPSARAARAARRREEAALPVCRRWGERQGVPRSAAESPSASAPPNNAPPDTTSPIFA